MTVYYPLSGTPHQYLLATGVPASGYVLKAYTAGTSTPIVLAIDNAGVTTASTVTLNSSGYPTVSGNVVILYVAEAYKIALYATQAAADVNTGAIWNPDNIPLSQTATLDGISDVLYDTSTYNNLIIGRNTAMAAGASFNVFVGEGAGSTASTSATDRNVALGYHALTALSSGADNTAAGSSALDAVNSGSQNCAFGSNALGSLTTATGNTGIGYNVLANNVSGANCTAVGSGALFSSTGASNTALGVNAGYSGTPNTTGTNNTFIGISSQADGAAYTNSTALGANAIITASNMIALGDSGVTAVTAGTGTAYVKASNTAKCWLIAGTTGNILASFNITSLTDTGTGDLAITIATDFSSANWACVVGGERTSGTGTDTLARDISIKNGTIAAGTISLQCWDKTATTNVLKDPTTWHMAGYGAQ